MIYTVGPGSRISARGVRRLLQLENTSLVGVVRDGRLLRPRDLDRLDPGDSVLVIAPPAQSAALDELFGERPRAPDEPRASASSPSMATCRSARSRSSTICRCPRTRAPAPLADFVQARLKRKPLIGDRLRVGDIELIVQACGTSASPRSGSSSSRRPSPVRPWPGCGPGCGAP